MIETANNGDLAAEGPAPSRPSWRVKLLFAVMVFVVAVACGEVLIRLFAPQPESWLDIYRRHPTMDLYAVQPSIHREVELGEGRWTLDTDEFGFRVTVPGPVDRQAVLCLGDSFTFGNGVNQDQSFVGLLHANHVLGRSFINAGVPGYGPIQYRQTLEGLLKDGFTPPAVVIATFVGNDFHDCVWKSDARVVGGILGNRGDLRSFVKRHSHGYRLVSRAYHRMVPIATDAYTFRENLYVASNWETDFLRQATQRYETEFRAIAQICSDRGIPLLVAIIPIRDALEPPSHGKDPGLPVAKAKKTLDAIGIRSLDLTTSLRVRPASEMFFARDGHLTPPAHRIAFEAIRAALESASNGVRPQSGN